MGDPRVVIVISSDDEEEEDEQQKQVVMAAQEGNIDQVVGEEKEVEWTTEEARPGWLPDGWIMKVCRTQDGTIKRYYTSPVSGLTFTDDSEVYLKYLYSGADERLREAKEKNAQDFLRKCDWLPKGWVLEIRAGGENMDRMYKYFLELETGVRLQSKEDVQFYIKEMTIPVRATDGECDISSKHNILANVELNPDGLPKGWVKELAFRRNKKGLTKYMYYTDPVGLRTFRGFRQAEHYVETGEIINPRDAIDQKTSVYDIYSFDKSTDLHQSLRSRLTVEEAADQEAAEAIVPCLSSMTMMAPQLPQMSVRKQLQKQSSSNKV